VRTIGIKRAGRCFGRELDSMNAWSQSSNPRFLESWD